MQVHTQLQLAFDSFYEKKIKQLYMYTISIRKIWLVAC